MTISPQPTANRSRYHAAAYTFVLDALNHAQASATKISPFEKEPHVSGPELLDAFRDLAYKQFGGMALVVFRQWGLHCTDDVGHIVWDLIDKGNMRKNDRDQLSDFFGLYDFEQEFLHRYPLNVSKAFQND